MASINSSEPLDALKRTVRSAAEAAAAAALLTGAAVLVWGGPQTTRPLAAGAGAAWLVSSASAAALAWARESSPKAFWWAFGLGMGARFALLGVLMAVSWSWAEAAKAALLLSYAFGVLSCLLVEYRNIRLK